MKSIILVLVICLIPLLWMNIDDNPIVNSTTHSIYKLQEFNQNNPITNNLNPVLLGDIIIMPNSDIPYAKLGKLESNSICRQFLIPKQGFHEKLSKVKIVNLMNNSNKLDFILSEPVHPNVYLEKINNHNWKLYRKTRTSNLVSFGLSSVVVLPYLFIFYVLISLIRSLKSTNQFTKAVILLAGIFLAQLWMFGRITEYGTMYKWEIVIPCLSSVLLIIFFSQLVKKEKYEKQTPTIKFIINILFIIFSYPLISTLFHQIIRLEFFDLNISIEPRPSIIYSLLSNYLVALSFILSYCVILAADSYQKMKIGKIELEQSQAQSVAQLNSLQARLNPHFLYNGLNSVASLIASNPEKAEEMTLRLSKFLKYFSNRNDQLYTTVEEELNMIKEYLAIEKIRFDNKLYFDFNIDPSCLSLTLPRSILQPIVENAVKYGFDATNNTIKLNVNISKAKEILTVKIYDSGPSFNEDLHKGFGLKSVYQKLDLLYKGGYSIDFINHPVKHVELSIEMNKNKEI